MSEPKPIDPPWGPNPAANPPFGTSLSRGATILVLTGILLGMLMGALDNFVVLTALRQIASDLGDVAAFPFVVAAYLISSTVATPIFGKLSDRYSRRNFYLLGLAIFIAGSILAGQSQTMNELIAFRAIQGFGSGAFFSIGFSIIAVLFPPVTRARLTGAFSSVFGIATVLGPFLGSYIVDHTVWRWVFYVNIPVGLAGMAILLLSLGPLRSERKTRFDVVGAVLLAAWVAALMFPLIEVSEGTGMGGWGWTDPRTLGLLALAFVLFPLFLYWETRPGVEAVVPLRYFRQRIVAASGSISLLRGIVFFSVTTLVSAFVANALFGSPDTVRDVLWAFVIPMILGSVAGGQLLTRTSYRALGITGMASMVLGVAMLTQYQPSTPLWVVAHLGPLPLPIGGMVLDLIPIGFGVGLTFATVSLSVQYAVPPRDIGAATSLVTFLQSLGGSVGLSVLSSYDATRFQALAAPFAGPPSSATAPELLGAATKALTETFAIVLVVAVAALLAALFLEGQLPQTGRPAGASPAAPEPAATPSV
jgi:MFS family permease